MKIEYDKSVDAAYIKLNDEKTQVPFGFTYCCNPEEVNGQIHLDFDNQGRLMGIEVLQASLKLPSSLLTP
jgi:uncharacterized protein YuzE